MSDELPGTLKVVIVWLLVGAAVFLAFQWIEREQRQTRFQAAGDVIEIRRGVDGHYHWPGTINGRSVDFLVDTGATGIAISSRLARELRLEAEGTVRSSTAGGVVTGEVMRADLMLEGGVRAERIRLVALPQLGDDPLLGMDVLGRLHWQQRDGVLRIDLRSGERSRGLDGSNDDSSAAGRSANGNGNGNGNGSGSGGGDSRDGVAAGARR